MHVLAIYGATEHMMELMAEADAERLARQARRTTPRRSRLALVTSRLPIRLRFPAPAAAGSAS